MKKLLIINHHCDYHSDLEIRAVVLDQLMKEPEAPSKECLLDFEVIIVRIMMMMISYVRMMMMMMMISYRERRLEVIIVRMIMMMPLTSLPVTP